MPIPQQLPVAIYEQEVPPICHLPFSLFYGTRHKDTLLAPSCVCEYWQNEISCSHVKSPKKSKSTDCRCPYCKANAVPPTSLMSLKAGSCIKDFNNSNVLGSTVSYDSICIPPFLCLKWHIYMKGTWNRVNADFCKYPQFYLCHNSIIVISNHSNCHIPKLFAQKKMDTYPYQPATCPHPRTRRETIFWYTL